MDLIKKYKTYDLNGLYILLFNNNIKISSIINNYINTFNSHLNSSCTSYAEYRVLRKKRSTTNKLAKAKKFFNQITKDLLELIDDVRDDLFNIQNLNNKQFNELMFDLHKLDTLLLTYNQLIVAYNEKLYPINLGHTITPIISDYCFTRQNEVNQID